MKQIKTLLSIVFMFLAFFVVASCTVTTPNTGEENGGTENGGNENGGNEQTSIKDQFNCITVEEAIQKAVEAGNAGTAEQFYVYGKIVKIENATYGAMTISDGTGELYVYGVYSADGETRYDAMEDKPVKGDEVVLYGILKTYSGTPEMDRGYLQAFNHIKEENPTPTPTPNPGSGIQDDYECITVAEAIQKATEAGSAGTADKFYVYGKVVSIDNSVYGAMTISDGTGELYVYGTYSADGETRYDAMEEKPVKGDEVVLYGILKTYNGTPEMDRGYLQAFHHEDVQVDVSNYTEMSVSEAREAEVESLIKLTGVVAQITYAFGQVPNGFYLVDNSGSIYIYGKEIAGMVSVGNTVTVAGEKTYYVLETEQSFANKHGYKGCCQLQNAQLVSNDKGKVEFDKSWIEESTVKEIMNTSVTENITTNIYKVTAVVKKVEGTGFTNYYIDDLDNVTGSYVYTACSGADFAWLDEFDGKICTVYLSPINAKSTSSGCNWRFIPVLVKDEGFVFDENDAPEYAIEYHAIDKFVEVYEADPTLEVVTSVSSELLGLEGVSLSYHSSNENVAYFEETEGVLVFHTNEVGVATITITAEYKEVSSSVSFEVTVKEPETYDYISVIDAINSADNTEVIVKGIVASSLVNRDGFYLIDETGIIAVTGIASDIAALSAGDEIIIKGIKKHTIKEGYTGAGQINIADATILVNYYGNHEYPTNNFIEGKTLADLYALDHMEDHSTEVYVVNAVVELNITPYYTSIALKSVDGVTKFSLYCSSVNQYTFLHQFAGEEITLEIAICNWNSKTYYTGCVISVITEDGKIINTLNFDE